MSADVWQIDEALHADDAFGIWGHSPRVYSSGEFAVGIKTCKHYHQTRLAAVDKHWAHKVANRVIGTDAPHPELQNETVVSEDKRDGEGPYIPPWAENFQGTVGDVNPWDLPRLTEKLAAILRALHDRYIDKVDWFLITDDDTFVRVGPMRTYLSHLDHNKPHLLGGPVSSRQFLLEPDLQKYGESSHCGGGSGIVMSRELLRRLRPHIDDCLTAKHTLLNWYWDEVEFARCIYALPTLGLNCTCPNEFWGQGKFLEVQGLETLLSDKTRRIAEKYAPRQADSKEEGGSSTQRILQQLSSLFRATAGSSPDRGSDGGVAVSATGAHFGADLKIEPADGVDILEHVRALQRMQLYEWGTRRFVGGLSKATDWVQYEAFVEIVAGGDWTQVGSLVFHTVLPERMPRLAAHFTPEVDAAWSERYRRGDADA